MAFPLSCPRTGIEALTEIRTEISSVNIELVQFYFVAQRDKLEEVLLVDGESLHNGAMNDTAELAVKQYGYLTESKQVTKVFKNKAFVFLCKPAG